MQETCDPQQLMETTYFRNVNRVATLQDEVALKDFIIQEQAKIIHHLRAALTEMYKCNRCLKREKYEVLDSDEADEYIYSDSELEVSDPEPEVPDPEVDVSDPEPEVPDPEVDVSDPEPEVPDPEVDVSDPEPEVPDSEVDVSDPEPKGFSFKELL